MRRVKFGQDWTNIFDKNGLVALSDMSLKHGVVEISKPFVDLSS